MSASDTLVLIHGFGVDARHFSPWLPLLDNRFDVTLPDLPGFGSRNAEPCPPSLDQLIDDLLPQLPQRAIYCGWSAGGMVVAQLARRYPARVAGILLLAANPSFVARRDDEGSDWPGMAPEVFRQFALDFADDAAATLNRFDRLATLGAPSARNAAREIARARGNALPHSPAAMQWLRWLGETDYRATLRALRQPVACIYAAHDALVPVECAEALQSWLPAAQIGMAKNASHWLPRDAPEVCSAALGQLRERVMVHEVAYRRDKRAVAQSFSRAARRYDDVAQIQATVRDALLARCDRDAAAAVVLDLGCGTGAASERLRDHYRAATLIGADLAEGMLQVARAHHGDAAWIVADAEKLPLADTSADRVVSSLAVQWCESPAAWLAEVWRVLKPGGRAYIATLGGDTLDELYRAWCVADAAHVHVNAFVSLQELQHAAHQLPWARVRIDEKLYCDRHASVREVLDSIRGIGAHNINAGRARGLTGRRQLLALQQAYETFRSDGLLPVSYHVIFCELYKPSDPLLQESAPERTWANVFL